MNIGSGEGGVGTGGGMVGMRSPSSSSSSSSSLFTLSQWQELEHQALILKYLMAGLPIPPDLLLPIQKSYEYISHRYFHHPTMGYYPLYGKKMDPEPGRCRRTDGKKWRCSKEAYPDSKYCERHMHRGRNRSRKPVESQTITQSSSTVTSLAVSGSSSGSGSFQSLPMHTFGSPQASISATNQSHYSPASIPYGIPSKDYRYLEGLKLEIGEHSFFSGPSGSHKGILMDPQLDNPWPLMQSSVSTFPSKSGDDSMLQNDYPQHSFFDSDYASRGFVKHEGQPLRPFFDEWPKTREAWSAVEDDRSNQTSFSTTQLSISIPMASSDVSTTSSRSPHDN